MMGSKPTRSLAMSQTTNTTSNIAEEDRAALDAVDGLTALPADHADSAEEV